ncbi:MAG: hypothetical protein LBU32_25170 [Clostridiales bacterium]|nr:hypothetical protein [Clostridiales bacterium]
MEKFTQRYEIDYQGLGKDLKVGFPRLMYYVQETSIRHSDSTKYTMKWYSDNKKGWVLTSWSVKVHKRPKLKDMITVKTYPTRFLGAIGDRAFEMFDSSGAPILTALSAWVFLDLEKQSFIKPSEELIKEYGPLFPEPMEKPNSFTLISKLPGIYSLASKREFTVYRRDIDANSHVNNVKYIEWAFDDIPEDIYQSCWTQDLHVNYKKQCRTGDRVIAEFYQMKGSPLTCVTLIKSAEAPNALIAEIYSKWREKDERN